MFGSRKDDEKKAKRSFWPWGRRTQNDVSEEQVEPKAEPAVEDVVSTVETPEVTPESASESSTSVVDVVPEIAQHAENKPVHHETLDEPTHKAPEASDEEAPVATAATEIHQAAESEIQPEKAPVELESKPEAKGGFFARMRQGLSKTRNVLVEGVAELFIGKKEIDDDLLDELETQLLVADVGVEATTEIIEKLTQKVKYKELDDADALMAALQSELADILEPADQPLVIPEQDTPFVILVVGVNGVGKTTTIGKLARKFQSEGRKVMLAAGDTFRAAAVEQLQVWGERNEIPVVAQHTGADSASVIFDAFEAARARDIDVLIADTAGRLHNKDHLMEELKKVKRVLGKLDPNAPHEVLLVLDAGTGQNALSQARLFHEAVQLTGMALTKLDGTAKGGVIFALSKQMKLPIRFLGVGEQIDDLRPFSGKEFVKALFSREG
ncbi:signal recognition particle-docking protein FtsY [Endozoicomonas atrinae]|uniref:signal recognition particle-docking protein FtsY n=1 Tax=Endozoicomonas atrinae TaxID=1333660 RepID=UPI003B0012A1